MNRQTGQTIIETMVALFIMVMGITAALGLASYSLNASSGIRNQIIGMGLAREGIEAVKNMRDTNWLQGQLDTNCYNFDDGSSTANCYTDWLAPTSGYTIPTGNFFLSFNSAGAANGYWVTGSALGNPWGLTLLNGLYTASGTSASSSGFYRQVSVTQDNTAPFNNAAYRRLLVMSRVWWVDKKCPASVAASGWPGLGKCSIELQTYLTNWKTY